LQNYAARFGITPSFSTEVSRIRREGALWLAETGGTSLAAPMTGIAGAPYRPSWPGLNLFSGSIVHSSEYPNPEPYRAKRILVARLGTSGGEIALDLAEAGVSVAMAVRGPVQILPRDLLGFPILSWAILYRHFPARLVDAINAPILRLAVGNFEELGLRMA